MLSEGNPAPDFELADHNGDAVRLSDFEGQRVVLYFYPKADTPGCTKQACSFRDEYDRLQEEDIVVLGVSTDSTDELKAFTEKYDLPFRLLSDPDGEVARQYDSLRSGRMSAQRNTFVIGADGTILAAYKSVSPTDHAEDILSKLDEMKA